MWPAGRAIPTSALGRDCMSKYCKDVKVAVYPSVLQCSMSVDIASLNVICRTRLFLVARIHQATTQIITFIIIIINFLLLYLLGFFVL